MNLWIFAGLGLLLLHRTKNPTTAAQLASANSATAQKLAQAQAQLAAQQKALQQKTGAGQGSSTNGGGPSNAGSNVSAMAPGPSLPGWLQVLGGSAGNQVATDSSSSVDLGGISAIDAPTYNAPDMSSWMNSGLSSGNLADSAPTFDYSGGTDLSGSGSFGASDASNFDYSGGLSAGDFQTMEGA